MSTDGAVGHHAVCLIKCRDRVLATSMQQTKPTTNLLHFPDEIRMLGLASDFKVSIQITIPMVFKTDSSFTFYKAPTFETVHSFIGIIYNVSLAAMRNDLVDYYFLPMGHSF